MVIPNIMQKAEFFYLKYKLAWILTINLKLNKIIEN